MVETALKVMSKIQNIVGLLYSLTHTHVAFLTNFINLYVYNVYDIYTKYNVFQNDSDSKKVVLCVFYS